MRLDDKTREIIKSEVAAQFGADTTVRLFGSRVDERYLVGTLICSLSLAGLWRIASRRNVACQPGCISSWAGAKLMS